MRAALYEARCSCGFGPLVSPTPFEVELLLEHQKECPLDHPWKTFGICNWRFTTATRNDVALRPKGYSC